LMPVLMPKRISAKFSHEGGKGEHVMECTTCHINITRAASRARVDARRADRGLHDLS
jgi:hypothetical protein